jgi:hypothetical protein
VTSILIGIAIDRRLIRGVDEKISTTTVSLIPAG